MADDASPICKRAKLSHVPVLPAELWLEIAEYLPCYSLPAFQLISRLHRDIVKSYLDKLQRYEMELLEIYNDPREDRSNRLVFKGLIGTSAQNQEMEWRIALTDSEVQISRTVWEPKLYIRLVEDMPKLVFPHTSIADSFTTFLSSILNKTKFQYIYMDSPSLYANMIAPFVCAFDTMHFSVNHKADYDAISTLLSIHTPAELIIFLPVCYHYSDNPEQYQLPDSFLTSIDLGSLKTLFFQNSALDFGEDKMICMNIDGDWMKRFAGDSLTLSRYVKTQVIEKDARNLLEEAFSGTRIIATSGRFDLQFKSGDIDLRTIASGMMRDHPSVRSIRHERLRYDLISETECYRVTSTTGHKYIVEFQQCCEGYTYVNIANRD